MVQSPNAQCSAAYKFFLFAIVFWLAACTTTQEVALPTRVETLPEVITVPYQISAKGLFVVDIAVNGHPARPFIVDTGAAISVIYEKELGPLGLVPNNQSVSISGLITNEKRPLVEDIEFQIGSKTFQLERIAVLESPMVSPEASGLLGVDLLADYAVAFNKEAMTVTFVPSKNIQRSSFVGWRRIPLRNQVGFRADKGLHFAQTQLKGKKVPVLIDTGSNQNIINWRLATLDPEMRRVQRRLRDGQKLYGALASVPLILETKFFDLILGRHYWPSIDVVVMELDTLSSAAPVDKPLMIAGAGMFTPWSVVFDLGGDALYIRANHDDPRPPSHRPNFRQSQFAPLATGEEMN